MIKGELKGVYIGLRTLKPGTPCSASPPPFATQKGEVLEVLQAPLLERRRGDLERYRSQRSLGPIMGALLRSLH